MASSTTASTVTEPAWLAARRERAAALTESLPLPSFRGKPGWEFTSLKNVDLDDVRRARAAPTSTHPGWASSTPPDGALLLEQVDHVFADPLEPAPDGAIVMSLAAAVAQYPELVEQHFGSIVSSDDPFVARNEAGWQGGAFVYVPRGVTPAGAGRRHRRAVAGADRAALAHARRPRGGRPGRGLGAVRLHD